MSPICVSINKNYKCDINKILTSCKGYNIIASRLITFHYVNRKMIPLEFVFVKHVLYADHIAKRIITPPLFGVNKCQVLQNI